MLQLTIHLKYTYHGNEFLHIKLKQTSKLNHSRSKNLMKLDHLRRSNPTKD